MFKYKAKPLLVVIFTILVALISVGCNKSKDLENSKYQEQAGKYYEYKEEKLTTWIELKKDGNWVDSLDSFGLFEIKDTSITIYSGTNSKKVKLMSGTISDGLMTITLNGITTIYKVDGLDSITPDNGDDDITQDDGSDDTSTDNDSDNTNLDNDNTNLDNDSDDNTSDDDVITPIVKYTVTFDSKDGNLINPILVNPNAKITEPSNPVKSYHNFDGWYTSDNEFLSSNKWSFSLDCVTSDITLYAKWNVYTYTISFSTVEGSIIAGQSVNHGEKIESPTSVPEIDGYIFYKWYSDVSLNNEFDISNETIVSSRTLYAGYVVDSNRIIYNLNGGTNNIANRLSYTRFKSPLGDPTKDNYIFDGWYTSSSFGEYPSSKITNISHNPEGVIELYAKWYSSGIGFSETSGGYEAHISNTSYEGELIFPGYYNGLPVINIYGDSSNKNNITSVYIPKTVKTIGTDAFRNSSNLTEIVFQEGSELNSIGNSAFYSCVKLVDITFPNNITSIGYYSFFDCSELVDITLPSSLASISDHAFSYSSKLININIDETNNYFKSVDGVLYDKTGQTLVLYPFNKSGITFEIPSSVTNIGDYAFSGNYNLESITIPDTITAIGKGAFSSSHMLSSVVIGNNVTTIGSYAFQACFKLSALTMPNTVKSIGASAIDNSQGMSITLYYNSSISSITDSSVRSCVKTIIISDNVISLGSDEFGYSNIENIIVEDGNNHFKSIDGVLYNKTETTVYRYPRKKIGTTFEIPSTVTTIWSYAFSYCGDLESIILPEDVTTIGDSAFRSCSNLLSFSIPNSVTSIGTYAFYRTSSLNDIIIPSCVTSIGSNAFGDNANLSITWYYNSIFSSVNNQTWRKYVETVILPDGMTIIGIGSFYNFSRLTSVIISDSVRTIERSAFAGCSSLLSVIIPNGVTTIGETAFLDCTSLNSVTMPSSLRTIGIQSFANTSLVSVTIPDSVTDIGVYAFLRCPNLESINVDAANNNYKSINGALYNKAGTNLITYPPKNAIDIEIPSGVTGLQYAALRDCVNLTRITLPSTLTYIGDGVFIDCNSLTEIIVDETSRYFESVDGVLYTKERQTIETYPAGKTETTFDIPSSVVTIGDYSFYGCINLVSITIPSSVKNISQSAFSHCTSLLSITIPDGVTSIEDTLFSECTSLETVIIPDSIKSIGIHAFWNCTSLTSITIPDGVTSIGFNAFWNCTSLTSITIPSSVVSIGENAFYNCSSVVSFTVEEDNLFYKSIDGVLYDYDVKTLYYFPAMSSITTFEVPSSVTIISNYAFFNCFNLVSVVLQSGVTSIGYFSFGYCTSLINIILPDTLLNIGEHAFADNTSLTSIIIPVSVESIGRLAFFDSAIITLYIEAATKPVGWVSEWDYNIRQKVWGYTE